VSALLRVAFRGELANFSEEAMFQLWGSDVEPVPMREFRDVAAAVAAGTVDRALFPVENTLDGSIQASHDAINETDGIHAVAETVVAVHHCLLGAPGATFAQVCDVFSHPIAVAQCGAFFRANPRLTVHAVFDTAAAVVDVQKLVDPQFAVVASRDTARRCALDIINADIEDRPDNQTRFLSFARAPQSLPAGTPARTMILLTTDDLPGALLNALAPFARHGANVRRIETRPTGEPWSYRFFVEFDHQIGDRQVELVVSDMAALSHAVRIVGTYPRWAAGRRGSIGWKTGEIPIDLQ
jgi:prephenate dehydratase